MLADLIWRFFPIVSDELGGSSNHVKLPLQFQDFRSSVRSPALESPTEVSHHSPAVEELATARFGEMQFGDLMEFVLLTYSTTESAEACCWLRVERPSS